VCNKGLCHCLRFEDPVEKQRVLKQNIRHMETEYPDWIKTTGSVLLIGMLVWYYLKTGMTKKKAAAENIRIKKR